MSAGFYTCLLVLSTPGTTDEDLDALNLPFVNLLRCLGENVTAFVS